MIKNQKYAGLHGQALIAVLLVLAVVLTTTLSITSRSTLDVSQSTYEEDALRAFSAAEAGVEKALLSGTSVPETNVDSDGRVKYEAPVVQTPAGEGFRYPVNLNAGDAATFWFVSRNTSTNEFTCSGSNVCTKAPKLGICWGNDSSVNSNTPAIEIAIYKDDTRKAVANPNNYADVEVVTITADPNSGRTSSNGFNYVNDSCDESGDYAFGFNDINISSMASIGGSCAVSSGGCLLMAKVRMLYNNNAQPLFLNVKGGNQTLPAQGYEIQSTGTAGESTRKVNVLYLYSEPQSIFNGVIFGYNNIEKTP